LNAQFSSDETETRAHVLSITAALLLSGHAAFVVAEFADDPVAVGQMNQAYYRSELTAGSYDRMRDNATAPDILENSKQARTLYQQQTADRDSPLMRLSAADPEYRELIVRIPPLQTRSADRLEAVAKVVSGHAKAEATARADARKQHKDLYAIRSVLFKDVSRLKSPTAHLIRFSDAQKRQVFDLLQPGDLVLSYTAGYASDVFIPGAFKHGITYVGTPAQRRALGLAPSMLTAVDAYESEKLAANLQHGTLPDGQRADMIEAVAEGVIFNNLAHVMDTHINRLLVLRPQLSEAERAEFLVGVFSYLGDAYDFRFDFADVSRQVCTEVIYRALNKKGSVDFRLTERAGHPTLSADDIANDFLVRTPQAFRFVFYAEEDPDSERHAAIVLTGREGQNRLAALMAKQKDGIQ
jgi:hypothetical protein